MTKSILVEYEKLDTVVTDKPYINIGLNSDSELGKKLCKFYKLDKPINTLIGDSVTVNNLLSFLTIPGYDVKYLLKDKLTSKEYKSLSSKRVTVPNYWSIVTHILWERITGDKDLVNELLKLPEDTVFTAFKIVEKEYNGEPISVYSYNKKMGRYIGVIKYILSELRQGIKYDDKDVAIPKMLQMMDAAKDKEDKKVFDDLPFEIVIPDKFNI